MCPISSYVLAGFDDEANPPGPYFPGAYCPPVTLDFIWPTFVKKPEQPILVVNKIQFFRTHLSGRQSACPPAAKGKFLFLTDEVNSPAFSTY